MVKVRELGKKRKPPAAGWAGEDFLRTFLWVLESRPGEQSLQGGFAVVPSLTGGRRPRVWAGAMGRAAEWALAPPFHGFVGLGGHPDDLL